MEHAGFEHVLCALYISSIVFWIRKSSIQTDSSQHPVLQHLQNLQFYKTVHLQVPTFRVTNPPALRATTMTLPKTFKAAVLPKAGAKFELQDLPLPQPGPKQVLVKVLACGVCGSDAGLFGGHLPNSWPIIPGHELIGDVVAVGADVTRFSGGERVGGPWHGGHDGTCKACQRSLFQMCDHVAVNGVTMNGGYAEYVVLREEAVVRVPADMDPAEAAPQLCAGVTVFNSIRRLGLPQGAVVAVQGLGGLGHLAVQFAANMGFEVAAVSSGSKKRDFAKQLGAHHYVDSSAEDAVQALQKLGGADLIVCTAPGADAINKILPGVARNGKVLTLAIAGPITVDTGLLVTRGVSVSGWPSGHAIDSEETLRFCQLHGIKCMIEKFPLADVQKAFDHMMSGDVRFRAVLTMT
jgi:D-arabinose 1-dehydrogenase-like Zn-dependent alcohol dehydrogenase